MILPLVLAAVPAVFALLLWAIVNLERFVLVAVLGAMVIPASLAKPGGANVAAVDVLLVVALIAWLITNAVGRAPDPWVKKNALVTPAVLWVAVNAASLAWSIKPRSTLIFTIQVTEITILVPVVFASLPRSLTAIRQGIAVLIGVTSMLGLWAIEFWVTHPTARTVGTYLPGFNKNALGSFLAAGLILAYALSMQCRDRRARALLGLGFVLNTAGVAASGSRGALLGAAAGVLAVSLLLSKRRTAAIAVVLAIGSVYFVVVAPNTARKTTLAGAYDSSVLRGYAWDGAIKKIEARPLLGTGGKTYTDTLTHLNDFIIPDPNNLFLLTWAELGIPGMAALIYLLFTFGRVLVRARRLPAEAAVLAAGAGSVTIALLVHFQVDVSWARGATTLAFAMMGLLLAATRLAAATVEAEPGGALQSASVVDEEPISVGIS